MTPITGRGRSRWSRITKAFVSIFVVQVASLTGVLAEKRTAPPQTCENPARHQWDFWIGDWDVFEVDGVTRAARVRVDRSLDGCVLHETYEDPAGLRGQSFSIYDASRNVWHQTWVTNHGQLLTLEGRWQEEGMVLTGSYRS